ncbi:unnamed protein product [Adineta ricciae]|uniref:Uncharacterized protein n=1 Tax=Adineta ricciae TaxID=249248 RepID=A0A813N370_ADIRI|nr:unnamed protein product [Adineta ricciae]
MSTKSVDINDQPLLTTSIKIENDADDDVLYDESSEIINRNDYFSNLPSTSTSVIASLSSAYKGKIEVTSKGRRKIFDGVRWQILCRRPECRKQTNKKSLCITHYKEEYETSMARASPWSNNLSLFQVPTYRKEQQLFHSKSIQNHLEDQNNTISTTDSIDNNEQLPFNTSSHQMINPEQIEHIENGRRTLLKNKRWAPLCKYDHVCRNHAKYDSLCIKHYEITQKRRRNLLKFHNYDKLHLHSNVYDEYRTVFTDNIAKRLKSNNELQTSPSSVTEQFEINSNENIHMSTGSLENNSRLLTSRSPGEESTSLKKHLHNTLSKSFPCDKQNTDQSVQTDLSIPLCCRIHQNGHSFYSTCKHYSTINTKSEPQCIEINLFTSKFL